EGTAVFAARGDASGSGEGGHFDRDARDLGSGLAEGAAAVLAPAADGARGEGGAGVAGAGRQRDDGLQVARGDAGAPVTLDARTELTALVATPPGDGTGASEGTAVFVAEGERGGVFDPLRALRAGQRGLELAGTRRVADLAVAVAAPAVDDAGRGGGAGVVRTRGDRGHRREAVDAHGLRAATRRGVAELQVGVVAPAPRGAAPVEGARVLAAGGDEGHVAQTGDGLGAGPVAVAPAEDAALRDRAGVIGPRG